MSADRHNLKSKMAYIEVGIIAVVGVIVAIATPSRVWSN